MKFRFESDEHLSAPPEARDENAEFSHMYFYCLCDALDVLFLLFVFSLQLVVLVLLFYCCISCNSVALVVISHLCEQIYHCDQI